MNYLINCIRPRGQTLKKKLGWVPVPFLIYTYTILVLNINTRQIKMFNVFFETDSTKVIKENKEI